MGFQKGNRLAKGGRRSGAGRKPAEVADLHRALFDGRTAEAAVAVLRARLEAGDLEAAKYICDRIFGRPRQAVDMGGSSEPLKVIVRYVQPAASGGSTRRTGQPEKT